MLIKKPTLHPFTKSSNRKDLTINIPEITSNNTMNQQTMVAPVKMMNLKQACSQSYLRGKSPIRLFATGMRSDPPRSVVSKSLSKPLPFRNNNYLDRSLPRKACSSFLIREIEPLKSQ